MSQPKPVKTFGIIGAGNLAWSLAGNLLAKGTQYELMQIISRTPGKTKELAETFEVPMFGDSLEEIHPDLDIICIATNDNAIPEVAAQLHGKTGPQSMVFHCSGTVSLEALNGLGNQTAVLWPMQTLARGTVTDFHNVPVFIEGSEAARSEIRELAKTLSEKVVYLNSEERLKTHLGAVMTGNFSNLMYSLVDELTKDIAGVDFSLFAPLAKGTIENSEKLGPKQAQSGPARRHDQSTIDKHVALLKKIGNPDLAELYQTLSNKIQSLYIDQNES